MIAVTKFETDSYFPIESQDNYLVIISVFVFIFANIAIISNIFIKVPDLIGQIYDCIINFNLQIDIKYRETDLIIQIAILITYITILATLVLLKNELNESTIKSCSYNMNATLLLIIYSTLIFSFIYFDDPLDTQIIFTISASVAFHIILMEILLLLSPFYKLFESNFLIILDYKNGRYFYEPEEQKGIFRTGSNVIFHIKTNNEEITDVSCSIKGSAYDKYGKLTNTDGLKIDKQYSSDAIDSEETRMIIKHFLSTIDFLNFIDYDKLKEIYKSNKEIYKSNKEIYQSNEIQTIQITDQFSSITKKFIPHMIDTALYLYQYILFSSIDATKNNVYNNLLNNEDEDDFKIYEFITKKIISKSAIGANISPSILSKMTHIIPHIICRIPIYMKQLYNIDKYDEENQTQEINDKWKKWQIASTETGKRLIEAYVLLMNSEISNTSPINLNHKWKKFTDI